VTRPRAPVAAAPAPAPATARSATLAGTLVAALVTALALALVACGGTQPPAPSPPANQSPPPAPVKDTRPELERRRDTACTQLGGKLSRCAVADSRALLAAGKITQQQFDEATKPEVVRALAEDWRKKCRGGYMSSRQVRVLEVCYREESECAPLEACLGNLRPAAK
jgi:hypothetical protein